VDLLDILKIAARRWYVVGVLLAVGVAATLGLASSVAPLYKVESQSILVALQPDPEPGPFEQDTEPDNPYVIVPGGLYPTLSAITRSVDGDEYRKELLEEDTEEDYTFNTSQEAPVIITEATAETPGRATELTAEVQDALDATLVNLQNAEAVDPEQQIVMRRLTTSEPVRETGNRNRVLLGGLAITLAASVGGAVLFDSLLSLRRRRRTEDDEDLGEGDADDGSGDAGSEDSHSEDDASGDPAKENVAAGASKQERRRSPAPRKPTDAEKAKGGTGTDQIAQDSGERDTTSESSATAAS
jgi:hypothetical protein